MLLLNQRVKAHKTTKLEGQLKESKEAIQGCEVKKGLTLISEITQIKRIKRYN
jgi:hypothetical protein